MFALIENNPVEKKVFKYIIKQFRKESSLRTWTFHKISLACVLQNFFKSNDANANRKSQRLPGSPEVPSLHLRLEPGLCSVDPVCPLLVLSGPAEFRLWMHTSVL